MSEKKYDVSTPCAAYEAMEKRWELIHALLGGTLAMRAAGEKYLPREPREKTKLWENRRDRSILYEAYGDTVGKLSSKPFTKAVTLVDVENIDPKLQFQDNINQKGNTLTQFNKQLLYDSINHGLTHFLVEYPEVNEDLTIADEEDRGLRPYWVHIKATDLFGWKTEINQNNGKEELTQIRFNVYIKEDKGDYNEETVRHIKVMTKDTWELHKKVKDEEGKEVWKIIKEGTHTFGKIPLVTHYTKQTGFMTGEPALEGLAWLNLTHWQSFSDQRNILRIARVGILCGSGFTKEEIENGIAIGPNEFLVSSNKDSKVYYAEHTGGSIQAGERDLEKLENRMEIFGLQPYLKKSGAQQTATGQRIDENRSTCDIHSWLTDLAGCNMRGYEYSAQWADADLTDNFGVKIFSNFTIEMKAAEDAQILMDLKRENWIRHETLLNGIKQRGILDEDLDVDKEVEKINQSPELKHKDTTSLDQDKKDWDEDDK